MHGFLHIDNPGGGPAANPRDVMCKKGKVWMHKNKQKRFYIQISSIRTMNIPGSICFIIIEPNPPV